MLNKFFIRNWKWIVLDIKACSSIIFEFFILYNAGKCKHGKVGTKSKDESDSFLYINHSTIMHYHDFIIDC